MKSLDELCDGGIMARRGRLFEIFRAFRVWNRWMNCATAASWPGAAGCSCVETLNQSSAELVQSCGRVAAAVGAFALVLLFVFSPTPKRSSGGPGGMPRRGTAFEIFRAFPVWQRLIFRIFRASETKWPGRGGLCPILEWIPNEIIDRLLLGHHRHVPTGEV